MRSLIIGIARTGERNDYVLNADLPYISMCGTKPEVTFRINCGQAKLNQQLNQMRYVHGSDRQAAITFFEKLITHVFRDIKYLQISNEDQSSLHIRLVMSPLELAQLPFEFCLAPNHIAENKEHLFAMRSRVVTITRELRQETERRYPWPHIPRILFAWAQPSESVPHAEHQRALEEIIRPLCPPVENSAIPEPAIAQLLTIIPNASLHELSQKIYGAASQGKPYTHVHILAHGSSINTASGFEFRLAMAGRHDPAETELHDGSEIIKSLVPPTNCPTVISLCACDSGNIGNSISQSGSLIQQLHEAGVPCVLGSQFPFSKDGSVTMVRTLFKELIEGCDPRESLHHARVVLKETHPETHDWASLVCYARFPDDFDQQLQDVNLKLTFHKMKVINKWADHLFKFKSQIPVEKLAIASSDLEDGFIKAIGKLSSYLHADNHKASLLSTSELRSEHFGLLASAYKRQAEHAFRSIELQPDKRETLLTKSRESLEKALEFYKCGFDENVNSHWNGVQFLSLKLILRGSFDENDADVFHVVRHVASRDKRQEQRGWILGTLAELSFLTPFLSRDVQTERITVALEKATALTKELAALQDCSYEKESTARQFERYIYWWPQMLPETYPARLSKLVAKVRNG